MVSAIFVLLVCRLWKNPYHYPISHPNRFIPANDKGLFIPIVSANTPRVLPEKLGWGVQLDSKNPYPI